MSEEPAPHSGPKVKSHLGIYTIPWFFTTMKPSNLSLQRKILQKSNAHLRLSTTRTLARWTSLCLLPLARPSLPLARPRAPPARYPRLSHATRLPCAMIATPATPHAYLTYLRHVPAMPPSSRRTAY